MGDTVSVGARLAGVRVVTTRGSSGEDRLRSLLEAAGADALSWPTCAYPPPRDPAPLEAARARLDRFDWVVFTSARAVAAVGEGRATRAAGSAGDAVRGGAHGPTAPDSVDVAAPADGSPAPTPRVAVVGPATARAAADAGWTVAVEGRGPGARGLAAQVAATLPVAGARVLFPAASGAVSTVEDEFTAVGARVTRVEAYRTVVTPPPAARVRADLSAGVDAVTFASPAAVEAVARALGEPAGDALPGGMNHALAGEEARSAPEARGRTPGRPGGPGLAGEMARALAGTVVVCIGPTTGAALARRGVEGVQAAATSTLEAMVDALMERFGGARNGVRRRPRGERDTSGRPIARAATPAAAVYPPGGGT